MRLLASSESVAGVSSVGRPESSRRLIFLNKVLGDAAVFDTGPGEMKERIPVSIHPGIGVEGRRSIHAVLYPSVFVW